jgi:DNA-binding NtrC family response regulator
VSSHNKSQVLVVDGDANFLRKVSERLRQEGHVVASAESDSKALAAAAEPGCDVAVLSHEVGHRSGLEILRELKRNHPRLEIVFIAPPGAEATAGEAKRGGAYVTLSRDEEGLAGLAWAVAKAAEYKALEERLRHLEAMLLSRVRFEDVSRKSEGMAEAVRRLEAVSHSDSAVLLRGEPGSGKELLARALHHRGSRARGPFLVVSCSALTPALFERELFGHVKNAVAGAAEDKAGLFENAAGGTLYLADVDALPPQAQARLLEVLQTGLVQRLGGGAYDARKVDVRVVASTHADLEKAVSERRFEAELARKLSTVSVQVPPLRDRQEDLAGLAHQLAVEHARRLGKPVIGVGPKALEALRQHSWPGNVVELRDVLEHAVLQANSATLEVEHLPAEFRQQGPAEEQMSFSSLSQLPYAQAKKLAMCAFEKHYLADLLRRSGNNVSSAARSAGVDRSNFRRLLKQYEVAGRSNKRTGEGEAEAPEEADTDTSPDDGPPDPVKSVG